MATITIKSHKYGNVTFFVRGNATGNDSGYVYLESKGKTGTLGKQLTNLSGSTLTATVETLDKVARKWHRQHLAVLQEFPDMDYGN